MDTMLNRSKMNVIEYMWWDLGSTYREAGRGIVDGAIETGKFILILLMAIPLPLLKIYYYRKFIQEAKRHVEIWGTGKIKEDKQ